MPNIARSIDELLAAARGRGITADTPTNTIREKLHTSFPRAAAVREQLRRAAAVEVADPPSNGNGTHAATVGELTVDPPVNQLHFLAQPVEVVPARAGQFEVRLVVRPDMLKDLLTLLFT